MSQNLLSRSEDLSYISTASNPRLGASVPKADASVQTRPESRRDRGVTLNEEQQLNINRNMSTVMKISLKTNRLIESQRQEMDHMLNAFGEMKEELATVHLHVKELQSCLSAAPWVKSDDDVSSSTGGAQNGQILRKVSPSMFGGRHPDSSKATAVVPNGRGSSEVLPTMVPKYSSESLDVIENAQTGNDARSSKVLRVQPADDRTEYPKANGNQRSSKAVRPAKPVTELFEESHPIHVKSTPDIPESGYTGVAGRGALASRVTSTSNSRAKASNGKPSTGSSVSEYQRLIFSQRANVDTSNNKSSVYGGKDLLDVSTGTVLGVRSIPSGNLGEVDMEDLNFVDKIARPVISESPKGSSPEPAEATEPSLMKSKDPRAEQSELNTQEYLMRTANQDDTEDTEYEPSHHSLSLSRKVALDEPATQDVSSSVERLLTPVHPSKTYYEPPSTTSRGGRSAQRRGGSNRRGKKSRPRWSDRRLPTPEWEKDDWDGPTSNTSGLVQISPQKSRDQFVVRRGVSGGMATRPKRQRPLSPGGAVEAVSGTSFSSDLDEAWSLKRQKITPEGVTPGKRRDKEGYLIRSDGRRDMRSARSRAGGETRMHSGHAEMLSNHKREIERHLNQHIDKEISRLLQGKPHAGQDSQREKELRPHQHEDEDTIDPAVKIERRERLLNEVFGSSRSKLAKTHGK